METLLPGGWLVVVESLLNICFLQLEEKKADTEKAEEKMVEEEQERDEAITSIQVRLPCSLELTLTTRV